jgi:hypothetical protein
MARDCAVTLEIKAGHQRRQYCGVILHRACTSPVHGQMKSSHSSSHWTWSSSDEIISFFLHIEAAKILPIANSKTAGNLLNPTQARSQSAQLVMGEAVAAVVLVPVTTSAQSATTMPATASCSAFSRKAARRCSTVCFTAAISAFICCTCCWSKERAAGIEVLVTVSAPPPQGMPLAALAAEQQCSRDRSAAWSSQAVQPNPRSSAWLPATSQAPGHLPLLFAWLPRRKIAKPKCQRHQYKSQPGSGQTLAKIVFLSGLPVLAHGSGSGFT